MRGTTVVRRCDKRYYQIHGIDESSNHDVASFDPLSSIAKSAIDCRQPDLIN